MNHRVVKAKKLVGVLIAGIFVLCVASSTLAQRNPPGPPPGVGPPPDKNPNLQDLSRRVDESRLRSAEMDVGTEEKNQKLLQAAIANMNGGQKAQRPRQHLQVPKQSCDQDRTCRQQRQQCGQSSL